MVIVTSGKTKEGEKCSFYLDGFLNKALDIAKERVTKRDFQYICCISGSSGDGKSTLAKAIAKKCCPWFDLSYVVFDGEEFIKKTLECKPFSSIILDESFASMNTKISQSKDFLKILSQLQIVRQKNLFIILCIPNFFDLHKSFALFMANHLIVVYSSDRGVRGKFLAFSKGQKRRLYIKGQRFCDYDCVSANFVGSFTRCLSIYNEKKYLNLKKAHLMSQQKEIEAKTRNYDRDKVIQALKIEFGLKTSQIAELFDLKMRRIQVIVAKKAKDA